MNVLKANDHKSKGAGIPKAKTAKKPKNEAKAKTIPKIQIRKKTSKSLSFLFFVAIFINLLFYAFNYIMK